MSRLLHCAAVAVGLVLAPAWSDSASAERRVALVVGNSAYQNASALPNPSKDARAIEAKFKEAGFELVSAHHDLGNLQFKRAIRQFEDAASDADIVVIFYAGHGIEIRGINYMIPVDAKLASDRDAEDEAITLDRLLESVEGAKRLGLVILDACRDNPFVRTMKRSRAAAVRAVTAGLNVVEPVSRNTLIAYAAKAGTAAEDGTGQNSPFTTALLNHLFVPGLELRLAFGRVRDEVLEKTKKRQEPFVTGSLGGQFISLVAPPPQPTLAAASPSGQRTDYELVEKIGRKEAWELFLKQHPTGFYSDLARQQLDKLAAVAEPGSPPSVTRKPDGTTVAALDVDKRPERPAPVTEEQRAWDRIKDTSNAAAFRDFIKRYPSSVLANTAQSRLEAIERAERERIEQAAWDKIKDSNNPWALRDFIKRHPSSSLTDTAQARLDAIEQANRAREAQTAWERIKDSGNPAAVHDFIKRHPSSELVATAQARLAALEKAAHEREEKARFEREAKAAEAERQRVEREKKAEEERQARAAEAAKREEERLAKLSQAERAKAERQAALRKAEEEERAKAAEAARREKAEREAALRREEAERQANLAAASRARFERQEAACSREQAQLATLSAAGSSAREDLKRLEQGLTCERLRSSVLAALTKVEPVANTAELVRAAQKELARVGCFGGAADGNLSAATKTAIKNYQDRRGRREAAIDVTDGLVSELKAQAARVCPLVCPAGKVAEGETCVAARKPEPTAKQRAKDDDEDKSRRSKAAKPQEAKPQPAAKPQPRVRQEAAAPARQSGGGGGGGGGGRPMIGVGF